MPGLFHNLSKSFMSDKKNESAAVSKAFVPNPKEVFTLDKKKYFVLLHAVNIPGIGLVSAADILVSPEAQKALVENGCIGSVIQEVK